MESITVYKLRDGTMIEDQDKALLYCENKMGEELDGLLKAVPDIGIRAKIALLRAIQNNRADFVALAFWSQEYQEVKEN